MPRLTFEEEIAIIAKLESSSKPFQMGSRFTCPVCKMLCPDNEFFAYRRHEDCSYLIKLPMMSRQPRAAIPIRVSSEFPG